MRGKVESLLLPILHTGNSGINVIAGKMAMSRQTLFRRLKSEGTTFEKVLGRAAPQTCASLSEREEGRGGGDSLSGGFLRSGGVLPEPSKRWTGTSPRAFSPRACPVSRQRRASESATIQAVPIRAMFKAFSDQKK